MTPANMLAKDRRTASERPTFQHRHFALVAEIIRNLPPDVNRGIVAADFVAAFSATNPRFDVRRFWVAAGVRE